MIYLDHASTTYVDNEAKHIIMETLNKWGNPSNLYDFGQESKKLIEVARESVAKSINASPSEIFFTSGASESNAWALSQKGKVVCSPYEHHNILHHPNAIIGDEDYINKAYKWGEVNDFYFTDYDNFVFSFMYVNNETGQIFPIKRMCEKVHAIHGIFHSDMTQAWGNIPIDVKELGVDMASFSGHKLHTPKGVGFLYVSEEYQKNNEFKPLIYGGGQESGFRAGTENVPYICALGLCAENYTSKGMIRRKQKVCQALKDIVLKRLYESNVPFYVVTPDKDCVTNILNIAFKNIEGESLMMALNELDIYVGVGSACSSGEMETSHVLKAMSVPDEYIRGEIRLSFDWQTPTHDVLHATNMMIDMYKVLTEM